MSTIHFHQRTTLTPEQYVRGLTDFGPGRSKLFGNGADEYLKVHCRAQLRPIRQPAGRDLSGKNARRVPASPLSISISRIRFVSDRRSAAIEVRPAIPTGMRPFSLRDGLWVA